MTDSTRRVIRTIYQLVWAVVLATPIIIVALPTEVAALPFVVGFAAWVALIARLVNTLEDHGIIPAWLKGDTGCANRGAPASATSPAAAATPGGSIDRGPDPAHRVHPQERTVGSTKGTPNDSKP